jgi:Uma2 family endonuclease
VTMTLLPQGLPLTRSDLDAMPDDGHRYELIDGSLVVTPAPSRAHQSCVVQLIVRFHAACPPDLQVLVAPFDVALAVATVVQPDVLVARRSDLTDRDLPAAPMLAVEVLSPSTRKIDMTLKRDTYEEAGCPSYWVVDPVGPTVTVWELQDGKYVEAAHATAGSVIQVSAPFELSFRPRRPARLTCSLRRGRATSARTAGAR